MQIQAAYAFFHFVNFFQNKLLGQVDENFLFYKEGNRVKELNDLAQENGLKLLSLGIWVTY